jgi:hypothetical protein
MYWLVFYTIKILMADSPMDFGEGFGIILKLRVGFITSYQSYNTDL